MARRNGNSGSGGASAGPMNTIIAGFVGLLVIVAVVILGPVLAGSIQSAVPTYGICTATNGTLSETGRCGETNVTDSSMVYNTQFDAASAWNPEVNTDLPTGESLWTTNVIIGGVVVLVFFISLAIYYIRVIA